MQLMSWPIARLGARFSFLFEPYHNRVMHSALGRFHDRPLDFMVGLRDPDGRARVLPFTQDGECLINCEQFERFNSITFRGYSEEQGVRFELNVHSVFHPQDERTSHSPAFYFEMRAIAVENQRWTKAVQPPMAVEVLFRLRRPDTRIRVQEGRIDLEYEASLVPHRHLGSPRGDDHDPSATTPVRERIVSLTPGTTVLPDGETLMLRLPVMHGDTGDKWRLCWGAHVPAELFTIGDPGPHGDAGAAARRPARFQYNDWLDSIDAVLDDAITHRDERLAKSRRLEKLLEQAPLMASERHLLNFSFQSWLLNTCLLSYADPAAKPELPERKAWFSVLEGSRLYQSTLNAECNSAMLYLTLWPQLLRIQFPQWARAATAHPASGGACMGPDAGRLFNLTGPAARHAPAEHNADFLGLLQAYAHWTGDLGFVRSQVELVARLGRYLLWTDRDGSGFPSEGLPERSDHLPAFRMTPRQTYLAIKRGIGLRAAADLLAIAGDPAFAALGRQFAAAAAEAAGKLDAAAWRHDHYAPAVDPAIRQMRDADYYAIYNGNGELLPLMIGQPTLCPKDRHASDILSAKRETERRYGCSNSNAEPDSIRISQNLWRDILARYLQLPGQPAAPHYWDMQVMSNTHRQSRGFTDAYVAENLAFYPRGITTLAWFLATPGLVMDRVAAQRGGRRVQVDPNRHQPARWPLLPLADWKAGKIPVCVVDNWGNVRIESATESITVKGESESRPGFIG